MVYRWRENGRGRLPEVIDMVIATGKGSFGKAGVVVDRGCCGKTGGAGNWGELGAEDGGGAVFLAEVGERYLDGDVSLEGLSSRMAVNGRGFQLN
jgi:hypothetical protein